MRQDKIKECKRHGFTMFKTYEEGVRWHCIKCNKDAVNRRRRRAKIRAFEYLGGVCCKCGYKKNYAALDIHHITPLEKTLNSSGRSRCYDGSWEKIKKELDSCILVCANCHRELHNPERAV